MAEYDEAVGIWVVKIGNEELELKPKMGDNRRFRRVMMDKRFKDDRASMFDAFEDWFYEIVKRDYPGKNEEKLKLAIEFSSMNLLEEVMLKFGWTTKEQLQKAKEAEAAELKKLL